MLSVCFRLINEAVNQALDWHLKPIKCLCPHLKCSNGVLRLDLLSAEDAVKLRLTASLVVFTVAKLNLRWLRRRKLIWCEL